jgi:hypothetical protein
VLAGIIGAAARVCGVDDLGVIDTSETEVMHVSRRA